MKSILIHYKCNLDGLIEKVNGSIHHSPHERHGVAQDIEAKDESVELK